MPEGLGPKQTIDSSGEKIVDSRSQIEDYLRQGNFRGSGKMRFGVRGDIEQYMWGEREDKFSRREQIRILRGFQDIAENVEEVAVVSDDRSEGEKTGGDNFVGRVMLRLRRRDAADDKEVKRLLSNENMAKKEPVIAWLKDATTPLILEEVDDFLGENWEERVDNESVKRQIQQIVERQENFEKIQSDNVDTHHMMQGRAVGSDEDAREFVQLRADKVKLWNDFLESHAE